MFPDGGKSGLRRGQADRGQARKIAGRRPYKRRRPCTVSFFAVKISDLPVSLLSITVSWQGMEVRRSFSGAAMTGQDILTDLDAIWRIG